MIFRKLNLTNFVEGLQSVIMVTFSTVPINKWFSGRKLFSFSPEKPASIFGIKVSEITMLQKKRLDLDSAAHMIAEGLKD